MKPQRGTSTTDLNHFELREENDRLRARLEEVERTLDAIRPVASESTGLSREVSEGPQLLTNADRSYRLLMEEMTDGALIVDPAGLIVYANRSLAAMLKSAPDQLMGTRLQDWVEGDWLSLTAGSFGPQPLARLPLEVSLKTGDGGRVPVRLAATEPPGYSALEAVTIVVTDLSRQVRDASELVDSEKDARELLAASDRSRLALLSVVEDQSEAEHSLRERTNELSELYELSRALAAAESLRQVLEIVGQTAVKMVHVTFARMALLDGDHLIVRYAHPVRVVEHDLLLGESLSLADLPHCVSALDNEEAVLVLGDDPSLTEPERTNLLLQFTASLCIVPLRVGDPGQPVSQNLGVLMLGEARSPLREPLTPEKMRLAKSIGDQAAAAIRRMSLHEQTNRRLRHLVALRTIDTAISGSFEVRTVINVLLEQATLHLGADAACLLLLDTSSYTLEHFASRGFQTDSARHARIRLGEGPTGRAALERTPIRIPDLRAAAEDLSALSHIQGERFVSYFAAPISVKGQTRGLIEILHRLPLHPDQEWFDFLDTMSNQAALAIENADLFRNLQHANVELSLAYDATIEGWSRALDLRDRETEGHTQRVADLTMSLWHQCGDDQVELRHIRWGALLHDIGKMGVPDGILLKPGALTDEEWRMMKQHPTFAHQMLAPIQYLRSALDIPYCHHEKWDGSGYPRGLKGEDIPKAARVFAVVDVWDALVSDRPYRRAWTREQALEHIREQSGKQFDPAVVNAFMLLPKG